MEKIHELYGREIWVMILQTIVDNCPHEVDSTEWNPLTKISSLFSDSIENKYIAGRVMFQLFEKINIRFQLALKIDYPPKSEIFLFPALKDIWLYFIERMYEEQSKKCADFDSCSSSKIVSISRYHSKK
jgi:hypothetical protein